MAPLNTLSENRPTSINGCLAVTCRRTNISPPTTPRAIAPSDITDKPCSASCLMP